MTQANITPKTILRVDASARKEGSVTRDLTNRFVENLTSANEVAVLTHELAKGLPFVDEEWVGANFTAKEERTEAQQQKLKLSDDLIADLMSADIVAIGVPVYNFGVPAALKAWIDLIARAGVTFHYTENGPEGLLKGKKAYLFMASGGTPAGADYDFATNYLRHMLSFIGIDDVTVIAADQMAIDAEASIARADTQLTEATSALKAAA